MKSPTHVQTQEEKESIRRYMEMVAQREGKAEEERRRKKAAADSAFKAVVEQTEKQNNEEDELRMLRYSSASTRLLVGVGTYGQSKGTINRAARLVPINGLVDIERNCSKFLNHGEQRTNR